MLNLQHRRLSLSFPRRAIFQNPMHILPMKHIIHMSPLLLIVVQIVYRHRLSGLPVPVDQLLEHDWITGRNINLPLVQPTSTVGGAGDRGPDFAGVV